MGEGNQGADGTAASILDSSLGPASRTSRPELAAAEEQERKRLGKVPTTGGVPQAPEGLEGPEEPAAPAPEGDGAPEGEGKPKDGKGAESAVSDEGKASVAKILAKYHGKPESIAQALKSEQALQNRTAEELKTLHAQLSPIAEIVERDYERTSDGTYVLRPDAAARALQSARGKVEVPELPDARSIRTEIEQGLREALLETHEEEDVDTVLQSPKVQARIEREIKEKVETAKAQRQAAIAGAHAEITNIVTTHLSQHPGDKEILEDISRVYEGLPEGIRPIAMIEGWLPFGEVAEMVRMKRAFPKALEEAYLEGVKAGSNKVKPTDAGSPGRSGARGSSATGAGDSGADFKARIMADTKLPGIETILGSR